MGYQGIATFDATCHAHGVGLLAESLALGLVLQLQKQPLLLQSLYG